MKDPERCQKTMWWDMKGVDLAGSQRVRGRAGWLYMEGELGGITFWASTSSHSRDSLENPQKAISLKTQASEVRSPPRCWASLPTPLTTIHSPPQISTFTLQFIPRKPTPKQKKAHIPSSLTTLAVPLCITGPPRRISIARLKLTVPVRLYPAPMTLTFFVSISSLLGGLCWERIVIVAIFAVGLARSGNGRLLRLSVESLGDWSG